MSEVGSVFSCLCSPFFVGDPSPERKGGGGKAEGLGEWYAGPPDRSQPAKKQLCLHPTAVVWWLLHTYLGEMSSRS